ncbi:MAG: polyprenol monophosphomannose synthase [Candidatus Gastranaerophilales bacterium]|nr:polyprenol monophosphomannose synthase [Candidatus Gastranaerophilales bacterium]
MNTLVIIPTYNEAENIDKIIPEIFKYANVSILVVDDNSSDGTSEIVQNLQSQFNNLFLLNRKAKLGLASAYIDGFKYGIEKGFDSFVQMDADFSHNPIYLKDMINNLENNDVVIASRNIKGGNVVGWGFLRNFISKGGSLYSRIILNCPIMDLTGGFNGWKKDILEKINLDSIISKGYSFQIEMKYKAFKNKAKIKEFPIIFEDRKYGNSKMSKAIFLEALINIIKIRFIR